MLRLWRLSEAVMQACQGSKSVLRVKKENLKEKFIFSLIK